jgi:DNA-directed RNA polymerase specialized sigma subunit
MKLSSFHSFTEKDQAILREGITLLSFIDRQIIINRFWENQTIEEIAETFLMSWDEVDQSIEESMETLKSYCLSQKEFSLYEEPVCSTTP